MTSFLDQGMYAFDTLSADELVAIDGGSVARQVSVGAGFVAGGAGGAIAGAKAGSFIPVVGTAVGFVSGAVTGAMGGAVLGNNFADVMGW